MKRIGVMLLLQESNSFNPVLTTERDFEPMGLALGSEVLPAFGDIDEIGGFMDGLAQWETEAEPVGLLRAQATSGGPLSAAAKEWFLNVVREQLREAGHLDGLLLAMHGAMVAEDEDDVEGLFLETIRGILGPGVPVVLTLDMHAYVTPKMTRLADAVVAYLECPHIDRRQTGQRGARALERILAGAKPAYGTVKLPMIGLAEVMDTRGPLLSPIFDRARRLEERDDVLSAAALMTQGWLDVPWHGWLTMVITDGNPEFADTCATELAEMCWERRQAVTSGIDFLSADESVPTALDLLGVAAPDDLDGSSLAGSVLHGQEMPERPVFAQYSGNPTTGDIRRCVVAGRYKYVFDPEDAAELHDVETDPLEMTNLAQDPDYREICERLHEACRMWGIDHGDPVFEPRNTADDSETAQPKQQH